jgi:hypothetical protein
MTNHDQSKSYSTEIFKKATTSVGAMPFFARNSQNPTSNNIRELVFTGIIMHILTDSPVSLAARNIHCISLDIVIEFSK